MEGSERRVSAGNGLSPVRGRLAEQTAFLVLSTSLRTVMDLVTVVFLARYFQQSEFGTYRQVLLAATLLTHLFTLGIPVSLLYFLPRKQGDAVGRFLVHTFSALMVCGLVVGGILLVAAGTVGNWLQNDLLTDGLRMAAWFPLALILMQGGPLACIAAGRYRASSALTLFFGMVQSGLLIGAVILGWPLLGILRILSLLGWLTVLVCLVVLFRSTGRFPIGIDLQQFRSQFKYSFPIGLSSIIGSWNQQLDKLLIVLFYPVTTFAVYSVGAFEIPLVSILPFTVGKVLVPNFVRMVQEGRKREILQLWHESIQKVTLLMIPIFWVFLLSARDLIRLLYGPAYEAAVGIFFIYLLLLPLRVTSYGSILQALGKTRWILRASALALSVNLVGSLALIRVIGWRGPAVATVVAQLVAMLYLLRATSRALGCRFGEVFPFRKYSEIFLLGGIAAIPGGLAGSLIDNPFLGPFGGAAITVAFFALLANWRGLIRGEDWDFLARWFTLKPLRGYSQG